MHIRPNSWRRTLPKVFGLYNRWWAQECPFIINPVCPGACINLSWRNANKGSILCGYGTRGIMKQQEAIEKVYTGAKSKEKPIGRGPAARLRLCLRCAASWKGIARTSGGSRIEVSPGPNFFSPWAKNLTSIRILTTSKDTPYKIWLDCTQKVII